MIPPNLLTPGDCPESCYPCEESGPGCFNNCIPAPTATISGSEASTSPVFPVIDGTYDITNVDPYACSDDQDIFTGSGGREIELFTVQGTVLVGSDLFLRLYARLLYLWTVIGVGNCGYVFEFELLIPVADGCPTGDVAITLLSRGWLAGQDASCETGVDVDEIATPTMTFNFA